MDEIELLNELREAFRQEAEERLSAITSNLLQLEREAEPDRQRSILEVVFREAHSLKGASRAVNLTGVEAICQSMESVLGALKRMEISISPDLCDALHDSVSLVEDMLAAPEPEQAQAQGQSKNLEPIIQRLTRLIDGSEAATVTGAGLRTSPACEPVSKPTTTDAPLPHQAQRPAGGTMRISSKKLDSLFLKVEELISLKLIASQHVDDLRKAARYLQPWEERRARIDSEIQALNWKIEKKDQSGPSRGEAAISSELLDFLRWNQEQIRSLGGDLKRAIATGDENRRSLGRMVDALLDEMKKVTMLPFSTLFAVFPKMVRELSRDQGKQADLVIEGGEVEIDKRILEELKDPLIHLLRNSLDHGLEDPAERAERGKPSRGSLRLIASQTEGDKVEIEISDDGRGIDPERVKKKAVASGLLSSREAEQLDRLEAISLIFRSGLSTSATVTKISGRGLGMAIVQEKVESLGGLLTVDSELGQGSRFNIVLPVTLATFRGILVRLAGEVFVLPSLQVDRVVRVPTGAMQTVEGKQTIPLDGRTLPLVRLADVLMMPADGNRNEEETSITVVVLGSGEKRIAFAVDEIMGEHEILVKGLGKQLKKVRNISGSTVLGSGKAALILNVNDLLDSSGRVEAVLPHADSSSVATSVRQKSVLVVDDSITSRILLKNILESSGYSVETAVDGVDAYTTLKTGSFGLVVSDVEMPQMTGFELTAKIRETEELKQTPVVLVTSLQSREDRERGVNAGANAYIVKSNFDQSNLLDVIRRLI